MSEFTKAGENTGIADGIAFFERMARECEERPTLKCRDCRDTAYIPGPQRRTNGMVYSTVIPCPSCVDGRCVQRGIDTDIAKKRVKGAKLDDRLNKDREALLDLDKRISSGERVRFDHDFEEPPI